MPVIQYHGTGARPGSSFGCTGLGIAEQVLTPPAEEPFLIRFRDIEDGVKPVYCPGDTVKGQIVFKWRHRFEAIRGIIARLRCTGEIHFGNRLVDAIYQNTFYQKQYYISGDGTSEQLQSEQLSSYPFIFTLPTTGIPQSFTGPHGSVKYFIDAVAKLRSSPFSLTTETEFDVNDQLNLNTIIPRDIVAGPIHLTFDNSNHFLSAGLNLLFGVGDDEALLSGSASPSRRRGEIQARLELEKRGFVPGEFIQFRIIILNQTRKVLPENTIEFQQVIFYKAHNITKDVVEVLAKSEGPTVDPRSSNSTWEGSFEVPEGIAVSSATNVASCITISYRLKVEIETGPLSRNLKYDYNVLIGTIPFQNIPRRSRSIDYQRQAPLTFNRGWEIDHPEFTNAEEDNSDRASLRRLHSQPSADCPSYLDLAADWATSPPPTYEEAMGNYNLN